MAEMLAAANTAFEDWKQRTPDVTKLDPLLLYMAFLGGFQAGHDYCAPTGDDTP